MYSIGHAFHQSRSMGVQHRRRIHVAVQYMPIDFYSLPLYTLPMDVIQALMKLLASQGYKHIPGLSLILWRNSSLKTHIASCRFRVRSVVGFFSSSHASNLHFSFNRFSRLRQTFIQAASSGTEPVGRNCLITVDVPIYVFEDKVKCSVPLNCPERLWWNCKDPMQL